MHPRYHDQWREAMMEFHPEQANEYRVRLAAHEKSKLRRNPGTWAFLAIETLLASIAVIPTPGWFTVALAVALASIVTPAFGRLGFIGGVVLCFFALAIALQ